MPFKLHKIFFFLEKKIKIKKHVCLPYLKFLDLLPKTHLFLYLAIPVVSDRQCLVVSSTPEEWYLKLDKRPPA